MTVQTLFDLCIRLLAAFLVSKAVLWALGADTAVMLLGLALLLVGASYAMDRWGARAGWSLARFLIRLNQLPSRREPDTSSK